MENKQFSIDADNSNPFFEKIHSNADELIKKYYFYLLNKQLFQKSPVYSIKKDEEITGFLFISRAGRNFPALVQTYNFINIGIFPSFRNKGIYKMAIEWCYENRFLNLSYCIAISKDQDYLCPIIKQRHKLIEENEKFYFFLPQY